VESVFVMPLGRYFRSVVIETDEKSPVSTVIIPHNTLMSRTDTGVDWFLRWEISVPCREADKDHSVAVF